MVLGDGRGADGECSDARVAPIHGSTPKATHAPARTLPRPPPAPSSLPPTTDHHHHSPPPPVHNQNPNWNHTPTTSAWLSETETSCGSYGGAGGRPRHGLRLTNAMVPQSMRLRHARPRFPCPRHSARTQPPCSYVTHVTHVLALARSGGKLAVHERRQLRKKWHLTEHRPPMRARCPNPSPPPPPPPPPSRPPPRTRTRTEASLDSYCRV